MSEMNTIRGTVRRAKAEGIVIPEHALRRWVRSGDLPCVHSGNRIYLCWSKVLAHIEGAKHTSSTQ